MEKKKRKMGVKTKIILGCLGGMAAGVGGMLIFRRYEFECIGRGIVKMISDPETMKKFQKMAEEAMKRAI